VSFVRDFETRRIVDPQTSEELQSRRLHYQDPRWFQTIIGPDGTKRFEAIILVDADGGLANPAKPGDHVLVSTIEYDAEGRPSEVHGSHPDLDRILEFLRTHAGPASSFTLTDNRRR
jgi:hypothetical protein